MMKDMNLSEELNRKFKYSGFNTNVGFDFNIKVLTSGNWANDSSGDK